MAGAVVLLRLSNFNYQPGSSVLLYHSSVISSYLQITTNVIGVITRLVLGGVRRAAGQQGRGCDRGLE